MVIQISDTARYVKFHPDEPVWHVIELRFPPFGENHPGIYVAVCGRLGEPHSAREDWLSDVSQVCTNCSIMQMIEEEDPSAKVKARNQKAEEKDAA